MHDIKVADPKKMRMGLAGADGKMCVPYVNEIPEHCLRAQTDRHKAAPC